MTQGATGPALFLIVCVILAGLLFFSSPAEALEQVSVAAPLVSSDQPELAGTVSDLVAQASALVARLYPGAISLAPAGTGKTDFSLQVTASQDGGSLALVLALDRTSDSQQVATLAWSGPPTPDLPLWVARGVFLLWSSARGTLGAPAADAPAYVDELPGSVLDPMMPPMGVAVTPQGALAVALITSSIELDHAGRTVARPGKSLAEKGVQLFAGGVASTPGGSLIFKPTMGRDLYRVQPGTTDAQKIPTGLELASIYYWTALSDGSALLVDSSAHKAFSVGPGRKRREIALFPNPSSWPTAYAAGPDGTIWVYDPMLRGARVFSAEGTPVDIVLPLVDPSAVAAPTAMAVGPDGGFILAAAGTLARFGPDGKAAWILTSLPGAEQSSLPAAPVLAVDWSRGLIYLCDIAGRRIVKILDRAWCREHGITNDLEERVIDLRARRAADEPGTDAAIARLYESAGATVMARAWWQRVEDADPGNADAEARLLAMEVQDLRADAQDLDARARSTLAGIGIETARPLSVQAIQKYELLLSKAPQDADSRRAMESLRQLFGQGGQEPAPKSQPLGIADLRLANLFPSLMHWYGLHPPGSVTVNNPLSTTVQKVRTSLFIPGFMDLPVDSTVQETLAPGQSRTFGLAPVFSLKVLDLQEDMAVQAQVTVTWTSGGQEQSASRSVPATIYRNTALAWDDTRKISSYITPNEATVSGFAARALAGSAAAAGSGAPSGAAPRFTRSFLQAVRIIDALGSYGITYVQNLDAPFSRALGKAEIIDTVHFPRVTLYNRTGDCSDTTALLCSLLESVGIRTAAITTPGHIFMAFNCEEPAENAPLFRTDALEPIVRAGTVWIPVETTVLSQGFVAAWASASTLVRRYSAAGPYEFIPVADMRDSFPALPLPPGSFTVAEPPAARVELAFHASLDQVTDQLYTTRVKSLETSLASLSGRAAVKVRVQEGILHAMFGRLPQAEATFRQAITDDPALVSPYVNLANVRLLSSDAEGALQVVKQGLARSPDSALLNLLAARIYSGRADAANAAVYLAKVRQSSPELASRFADLAPRSGGTTQRAADQGAPALTIWGDP